MICVYNRLNKIVAVLGYDADDADDEIRKASYDRTMRRAEVVAKIFNETQK